VGGGGGGGGCGANGLTPLIPDKIPALSMGKRLTKGTVLTGGKEKVAKLSRRLNGATTKTRSKRGGGTR